MSMFIFINIQKPKGAELKYFPYNTDLFFDSGNCRRNDTD